MPKKRQRKLPVGWRPGVGNRGTDHPSVVRDRDPEVRARLQAGYDKGYKHAYFDANPACCPICERLNNRKHLIKTILRWKHVLPHPNCLCTWTPSGLSRTGKVSQLYPKDWPDWPKGQGEMETVRIFTLNKARRDVSEYIAKKKAEQAAAAKAPSGPSALHEELVEVHRGGKVFQRHQKKKDRQDDPGVKMPKGMSPEEQEKYKKTAKQLAAAAKPGAPGTFKMEHKAGGKDKKPSMLDAPDLPEQSEQKKKELAEEEAAADQKVIDEYIAKAEPGVKEKLNQIGSDLKEAVTGLKQPGDRSSIKIGGKSIPIVRGKGAIVRIGGIATTSMRGAALMLHGLEQASQSGAMMASGVMNAGVAQQGAMQRTVQPVQAAAERGVHKVEARMEQAKARREQLRRAAEAEAARAKAATKRAKKAGD